MHSVERGRALLQGLRALAGRTGWEWRRCPRCGETETCTWGSDRRRPWFLRGREAVRVQRHRCHGCGRTYSEGSALLVRGGWYAREVRRSAIDHWQYLGTSTRRTAEVLRSWLGHQERWRVWRPLDPAPPDATACHLSASTVERWLDQAGQTAQARVAEQVVGAASSGQMATDGLWARLRGGTQRVVLALVDNVTGVVWPPVVVAGESTAAAWATLFTRAGQAGLVLSELRGIASDGATGLESYRRQALPWVSHQRCVFHLWRSLAGALATAVATVATDLVGAAARTATRQARRTLVGLVRAVYDASTETDAQAALARLAAHALGAALAA